MGTAHLPWVHLTLKQFTRFTRKYTPKYPRTLSWYFYPSSEQEQSGMNSSDQWTVNSAGGNTWPDVRFFCRPVTAQVPAARLTSTEIPFFTSEEIFQTEEFFILKSYSSPAFASFTSASWKRKKHCFHSSNIPFVFIYLSTFLGMCCWHWLPSVLIESRNT